MITPPVDVFIPFDEDPTALVIYYAYHKVVVNGEYCEWSRNAFRAYWTGNLGWETPDTVLGRVYYDFD